MYDIHRRIAEEPAAPLARMSAATREEDFLTPDEVKAYVAQLLPDQPVHQTLEAIAPQPTLRIRVEHSRTIKDGWSYSTTVEMDGVDITDFGVIQADRVLTETLARVRFIAEDERDIRNQRDNAAREATAPIVSTAS